MNEIIRDLAQPFPAKYVHTNPSGGGSYVKHHVVEQRLIQVLGTPPGFKMVEILRGDVDGFTAKNGTVYPDLANVIVGVVARMTVTIGDDVREVEECGDCEQPHNWKTDGQRLKDAMSDAYKRCAMRLGCGLHLWSQNEFFLFDELSKSEGGGSPVSGESREQAHVNPPSSESSPEGTTASQQNGDTSPSAVPSGEPPWWRELADTYGAAKVKEIASAFSKTGEPVKKLEQLDNATPEQQEQVRLALAETDWTAPAKANA